jgi:NTE family protein
MPNLRIPIITGVSAGAINAVFLAAHAGNLAEAAEDLTKLWAGIGPEDVFRADGRALVGGAMRWILRLGSGGSSLAPSPRALMDTEPLRRLLRRTLKVEDGPIPGIAENLERGRLEAVALATVDYGTGQTVNWAQGREIEPWKRPTRRSHLPELSGGHIMASSALPLAFPTIRIGDSWFGDGGIRQAAPLSPALHLGAERILAVSTRYEREEEEANTSTLKDYPPPAQIAGNLMNAIFLDVLDREVRRLERLNGLIGELPEHRRGGLRKIDLLLLRPSQDLGKLSAQYEIKLPRAFRFFTRSLGTKDTASPDFLSLLMFQPEYLQMLIQLGEQDAEARLDDLKALFR